MKGPTINWLVPRLRRLRELENLTQEAFAEKAGMSYKYYQAVEAGRKRDLRLSTLERLARAHGLHLHELLAPELPSSLPGKASKRKVSAPANR